ncbi:PREDICTED: uncharacterized protein LOC109483423 [Branchiostoma belcheri]|uniref:Uncharacterized protein LOC109483423 n=1 Tax=Branchiostoma belcheri TaxID=7741 RepID=A0A6P4ZLB1_BRABE|nr:PREDICTED: uncharacterized protein LOC109483423 [Branchiostoma belcheri]
MMSKRKALMPDVFKRRKRVCVGGLVRPTPSSPQWGSDSEDNLSAAAPSDTKAAMMYLCSLFPKQTYEGRIPPIIMKHQLYSVVKNKTLVDRQLNDLRNAHEVKMMKLGNEVDEYCLVFTEDYKNHITMFYGQEISKTVERFLKDVVSRTNEMCVTQQIMTDQNFTDVEITWVFFGYTYHQWRQWRQLIPLCFSDNDDMHLAIHFMFTSMYRCFVLVCLCVIFLECWFYLSTSTVRSWKVRGHNILHRCEIFDVLFCHEFGNTTGALQFTLCCYFPRQLVNAGVLTVRDLGSWWLAIPGAGLFVKLFTKGRKAVLASIRKSKYKEILKQELESRKMSASVKLGMSYHIHDIIGADLVTCIETTSGELLRLKDD